MTSSSDTGLRAANQRLYDALSQADMDGMTAVWLSEDWVECVHPGWPALRGWSAIQKSWDAIFRAPARVTISVSDVRLRIVGNVGFVTCVERISNRGRQFLDTTHAQATNVFVRADGSWKLVIHHASSIAATGMPVAAEPESIN